MPTRNLQTAALILLAILSPGVAVAQQALPMQSARALPPGVVDGSDSSALPDAPSASSATESSVGSTVIHAVTTVAKDEVVFIKAPFKKKNLKWDALFVAAVAPLIATDEHVAHAVNPEWNATSKTLSNALVGTEAASAGAIFVTGLVTDNEHAKDTGVATARAVADSVVMYTAMKLVFQRERPFSGGAEGKFFSANWTSGSFPSGHSMFDWTIASVIAHEYPKWPVALAMYSMALAGSGSRVTAGVHFPADVVVGSTFGFLIGRYVAAQENHLPGHEPSHRRSKLLRAEDAVLSHVTFSLQ